MIQRLRKSLNWKYAIGEVVLIFIGITLAMWFNNWNEDRKDRKLEQQYLIDVHQDLLNDTSSLNLVLKLINGHIISAENILAYMDSDILVDTFDMLRDFQNAGFLYFYNADLSTYNDLVNSGNLRVVQDKKLKDMLSDYVSRIKQIDERYELNKKFVWYDYGLHMSQYFDGRLRAAPNDERREALKKYPVSWQQLRRDTELKRKLTMVISGGSAETRWHSNLRTFLQELITYLESLIK